MKNLMKLLAGRVVSVEFEADKHDAALEGCEVVSDLLVLDVGMKAKHHCPGLEVHSYDPGQYACPWSKEALEKYADRIQQEDGSFYVDVVPVRETVVQMEGFQLTLRSYLE